MSVKNNDYPNLGKNIRGFRKVFGETQLDLALAIGATGSSLISQYESGERIPERDYLLKIAKHFRITENELLNGSFENMKSLKNIPVQDQEYSKEMLFRMFPLICTPQALDNPNFKEAYEIHTRLIEYLLEGHDSFSEEDLNQCLDLYKKARRNGIEEATANHLWWLMVLGVAISFCTPRMLETVERININKLTTKDFFDAYLPSFAEGDSASDYESNTARMAYLEEYEVKILVDIALLRRSKEYSDLGDYYLALRHKFGLLRNTLSMEMNNAVGDELICTFHLLENKYCDNFISGRPHN